MPSVPSDAPCVERGVGFFETVLLIGQRAVFLAEHVDRLKRTLDALGLPAPAEDRLRDEARRAVAERAPGSDAEAALRLTWMAVGKELSAPDSWRLDVSMRAIPALTLRRRSGARCITLPGTFQRDLPQVKSTSYLASVLGLGWAERNGGDEGLFVDASGSYLEGTSTGLVVWNGARPAPSKGPCLPSVTAAAFLAWFGRVSGRPPEPSGAASPVAISQNDLASGALVLGALTGAAPLLQLDGAPCARPPEMLQAIEAFNREMRDSATPL